MLTAGKIPGTTGTIVVIIGCLLTLKSESQGHFDQRILWGDGHCPSRIRHLIPQDPKLSFVSPLHGLTSGRNVPPRDSRTISDASCVLALLVGLCSEPTRIVTRASTGLKQILLHLQQNGRTRRARAGEIEAGRQLRNLAIGKSRSISATSSRRPHRRRPRKGPGVRVDFSLPVSTARSCFPRDQRTRQMCHWGW